MPSLPAGRTGRESRPIGPFRRNISGSVAHPAAGVATGCYHLRMKSVGIKVLNSKLSEYVRLAASGETVLVTDRDQVVAELGPPRETRSPTPFWRKRCAPACSRRRGWPPLGRRLGPSRSSRWMTFWPVWTGVGATVRNSRQETTTCLCE